jgi:cytochrome-b5 reductase
MVKHYPNGKASTYLHSLVQGESLFFLAALRGYPWSPNKYSHVTLIAGGAGITPMYQLIQGILRNPDDRTKITLVYGANTDEDLLFTKEFDEYEKRFSDRFNAVFVVTHPSKDSPFKKGYVSKALLEDAAGRPSEKKNTKVFICGPPAMEAALVGDQGFRPRSGRSGSIGILAELGYIKDQIHKF